MRGILHSLKSAIGTLPMVTQLEQLWRYARPLPGTLGWYNQTLEGVHQGRMRRRSRQWWMSSRAWS